MSSNVCDNIPKKYSTELSLYTRVALRNFGRRHDFRKPLIICFAGLGDLLLCRDLIEGLESDEVSYLTYDLGASVVPLLPKKGPVYTIDRHGREILSVLGELNKENFTAVLSIRSSQEILHHFGLGGSYGRWYPHPTYETLWGRLAYRWLFARRNLFNKHMTMVHREMIPRNHRIQRELSQATMHTEESSSDHICIHLGGQDSLKRLVDSHILEVICRLGKVTYLLGYGREDHEQALRLAKLDSRIVPFTTNPHIPALIELISAAWCVVAPDSFVMHLTAMHTTTPLVAIMGNASPRVFGPSRKDLSRLKVLHRNAACSPCRNQTCEVYSGRSCVQDITAAEIVAAVKEVTLKDSPPGALG